MDRLDALRDALRAFVTDRAWDQFHDPKNLAMAVASEAGELAAELRWVPNTESDAHVRAEPARQRIADEVGDVALTLLMFADRAGLDLATCMENKLAKNLAKFPVEKVHGKAGR